MAARVAAVLVALGLTASWRPAEACSQSCVGGGLLPGDGATIPANADVFLWNPSTQVGTQPTLRLTKVGDPTPLVLEIISMPLMRERTVTVKTPLVHGAAYVLEEVGGCLPLRSTFTAGPEAPLPSTLGKLKIGERGRRELQVFGAGGGCDVTIDAGVVGLSVDLDDTAQPWRDLLAYETLIDGKPWNARTTLYQPVPPGASWQGRGEDLLFRGCEMPSGLTDAAHEVEIRASVPFRSQPLRTQTVSTEVSCAEGGCSTSRPATLGFMLLAVGLMLPSRRCRR